MIRLKKKNLTTTVAPFPRVFTDSGVYVCTHDTLHHPSHRYSGYVGVGHNHILCQHHGNCACSGVYAKM